MTDTFTLGRDVELEVRIAAPCEAVFDFLVDPEKMLRWMALDLDVDPQPGGRFWAQINPAEAAEGEYVVVERPSTVSFTWGWVGSATVPPNTTTVTFELIEEDDQTVVRLTHSGLPTGEDDKHEEGWTYFLGRLGTIAIGGDPDAEEAK